MGVAESREPVTEKTVSEGNSYNLIFGLCEMQGWRPDMEDATIVENDEDAKAMLFGVLDGHGGRFVSRFVAKFFSLVMKRLDSYRKENYEQALIETFIKMDELLKNEVIDLLLKKNDIDSLSKTKIQEISNTINNEISYSFEKREASFERNKSISSNSHKKDASFDKVIPLESKFTLNSMYDINNLEKNEEDMQKELKSITLDNMVNKEKSKQNPHIHIRKLDSLSPEINIENLISFNMGTTANILFIKSKVFYLANVGDSRAVLFKAGKAIRLNEEHKPSLISEQSRIAKAGFNIISNRIDGKLNLTRAIGKITII